jgi:ABC-type phosphate transport system ATPase subunit
LLMGEDRVGELVEAGPADQVLHSPHDPRALDYVSGKVG